MSVSAAAAMMSTQVQIIKAKCVSLLSQYFFHCQQNEEISAEYNDMAAGRACSSTSGDVINSYSSFQTEYQENLISERCQLMYNTWRRKRNWHLESSSNQTFSEVSRDGKFAIGLIGKDGGYLELRNGAIQLYVPPGSMAQAGDAKYVFLYSDTVQCNLVYYDVIICGPPGLTFNNSVLLRFPKSNPRHEERVLQHKPTTIKLSAQQLGEPMVWKSLDTSTDGFCFLEDSDVFLHLNHFTGIKVDFGIQTTSNTEDQLSKTIYISFFLEQHNQGYFSFRVYCSTHSALTLVMKEESDSNSRKVGNPVKVGAYQSHDEVNVKIVECVDCQAVPSDYTIRVGDVVSDVGYIFRQFLLENLSNNDAFLKFQVNVGDKTIHIDTCESRAEFLGTTCGWKYIV